MDEQLSFCICTYNSSNTLSDCLWSIKRMAPLSRLIVVDRHSRDETAEIATRFGAEIFTEEKGLGNARQFCFDIVNTQYVVFVDGDVEILRHDFFQIALHILGKSEYGAVVGMARGHRFSYGLPASLLVLRKRDFAGKIIPDWVQGRETYFIQRRLEDFGLATYYISNSMEHRSLHREFMPEYQGAYTRLLPSPALKELSFVLKVILLRELNSGDLKNVLYIPIFYLKFLRGFANPKHWVRKY